MRVILILPVAVLLALSGCGRGGNNTNAGLPPGDPAGAQAAGEAAGAAAGRAADAAALDARLVELRQTDPAEFEREASAIAASAIAASAVAAATSAGGDTDVRPQFIALLRLAEYKRDTASSRESVPHFLRLISLDAERAATSGVLDVAFSALADAGLLLEVDCIERSLFRGRCAAVLLDELYPAEPSGAAECASRYLALTPSYTELAAVDGGACEGVDGVLFQCRVARTALEQLDAQATVEGYARFADSLLAVLSSTDTTVPASDALLLQACCAASVQRLSRMFSGDFIMFRAGSAKKLGSAGKAELLVGRLCELSLDCLDVLMKDAVASREQYLEVLQQHVEVLKSLNQRDTVVGCYTRYVSRFTEAAHAAPIMLELADYYREGWKTPDQARDAYAKVWQTYPDSAEARVARLKQALCLYELGAYEDAYALLQEMIAAGLTTDPATAEFLLGLTEAAMDLNEDAEARLIRLINTFPAHETAAKSVFWIANSRFARQDYKGAKEMFAELVQRYPKSSYARKAGEYVKRLETLDAAK